MKTQQKYVFVAGCKTGRCVGNARTSEMRFKESTEERILDGHLLYREVRVIAEASISLRAVIIFILEATASTSKIYLEHKKKQNKVYSSNSASE